MQLVDATGSAVASTTTDAQGDYRLTAATAAAPVRVRVLARLAGTGFDFSVADNTDSGALYGMDSQAVTPPAGTPTTVNVHAPSGWGGSSYTATRVAGPFAVLDVAYMAKEKLFGASPSAALTPVTIFWSPNNVPADGTYIDGRIGTSSFLSSLPANIAGPLGVPTGSPAVFLLGAENTDTDEYDSAVVAHEIGHYVQHVASRDDSIGGQHTSGDRLDMRVAFSEGWGYGWSSMVRESPVNADSLGARQSSGFDINVTEFPDATGWYSEGTVQYLMWQHYQDASIGFGGIYAALTSLRTAPTFSTIFSFNEALRAARPAASGTIASRSAAVGVNGNNGYGDGETNDGTVASSLPVYKTHTAPLGAAQQYCLVSPQGTFNKLGNTAFVRFTASGTRTIRVARAANTTETTDPDVDLVRSNGQASTHVSEVANVETISNVNLPSGTHVMAIGDFELATTGETRCFERHDQLNLRSCS